MGVKVYKSITKSDQKVNKQELDRIHFSAEKYHKKLHLAIRKKKFPKKNLIEYHVEPQFIVSAREKLTIPRKSIVTKFEETGGNFNQ